MQGGYIESSCVYVLFSCAKLPMSKEAAKHATLLKDFFQTANPSRCIMLKTLTPACSLNQLRFLSFETPKQNAHRQGHSLVIVFILDVLPFHMLILLLLSTRFLSFTNTILFGCYLFYVDYFIVVTSTVV